MTRRPVRRPSRRRPGSLGEMISSVAFLGMGGWLLLEGFSLSETAPQWRVWGLYICAFFCALGAFRFVIAGLWDRLFEEDNR